jgi:hypothetical protein
VVEAVCSLEISAQHNARNAVQALEAAHPWKYLLVCGSWLPGQRSSPLWKSRFGSARMAERVWRRVVETFIDKIDCESDFDSLFAIFLPVILREYF